MSGEVLRGCSLIQVVARTRICLPSAFNLRRTLVRSRNRRDVYSWSQPREAVQAKGGKRRSSSSSSTNSSRVVNSDKKRDEDEDSEAERDRAERERLVLLAKRATLDARIIVQAAEKQGRLPALKDLVVEESWKHVLSDEFEKRYFLTLERFLHSEQLGGTPIYPPMELIFRAFNSTPFENVRVVILGQDPYHGENQATGLSFSVPKGTHLPSSLQNIFKELDHDLHIGVPSHGDLSSWSAQGVLLLNTVLTVRARQPNSHRKMGWEELTNAAIIALSSKRHGLFFVLWGRQAQQKASLIDESKHHILHSAHPSGLSAHKGFFGSRPFSRINQQLVSQGSKPIEWGSVHSSTHSRT